MTKHEEMRRQLWTEVTVNVAASLGCQSSTVAIRWADEALKAFDERFKQPIEPPEICKLNSEIYPGADHDADLRKLIEYFDLGYPIDSIIAQIALKKFGIRI